MKKHLGSREEFSDWLGTMFLFYFINRIIQPEDGDNLLGMVQKMVNPQHQESGMVLNKK